MNRFFDIPGVKSMELAPWEILRRGITDSRARFQLLEPLRFRSDIATGVIVVPLGYLSDLASIPQAAQGILMVSDDPGIALGAWIHDLIYQNHGALTLEDGRTVQLSRQQGDRILCSEAMAELSSTPEQRQIVYETLRIAGDRWPGEGIL